MKVILFGASGMVGQGVLRECLLDRGVERVLSVVRKPTGVTNDKLEEIAHPDFFDFSSLAPRLAGFDACFFCLGISSAGMKEADYHRVTYDITLAAARALVAASPGMTFVYVSGAGTDSTAKGRSMWARVKGQTENDLLALPFGRALMFRPAMIQPLHGIKSRTLLYRIVYIVFWPLLPLFRWTMPKYVTTTERVGRAMIAVARDGFDRPILENGDIDRLGRMALEQAALAAR